MESSPEEPLESGLLAREAGYLQSKWIGERLCQIAAERTPIKTNVIRVGLLTGGLNGFWDPSHWVPSLVQSATAVNCLPGGDAVRSYFLPVWVDVHLWVDCFLDSRSQRSGCSSRSALRDERNPPYYSSSSSLLVFGDGASSDVT